MSLCWVVSSCNTVRTVLVSSTCPSKGKSDNSPTCLSNKIFKLRRKILAGNRKINANKTTQFGEREEERKRERVERERNGDRAERGREQEREERIRNGLNYI